MQWQPGTHGGELLLARGLHPPGDADLQVLTDWSLTPMTEVKPMT